jgi:hypothetical protein
MREQENLFVLCDDELEDVIKNYVFEQLPTRETNSGLAVEIDSFRMSPIQEDGSLNEKLSRASQSFLIVTLTNKFLRFHLLDNDLGLSKAGFRHFDQALEEGRISQRGYDTALDRYGCRYFHIPNQIWVHQVPLHEVETMDFHVKKLDRSSASTAWNVRQLKIWHLVSLDVFTTNEKIEISSYFRGILELYKQLEATKN